MFVKVWIVGKVAMWKRLFYCLGGRF